MIAAPTTWISGTILTALTIIAKPVDKIKVGKIQDAVNDLVAKSKVKKVRSKREKAYRNTDIVCQDRSHLLEVSACNSQ